MAKKPDRVLKGTRSVAGRGKTRYLVHAETAGMIDEAQGVLPDEINYATILRKAIDASEISQYQLAKLAGVPQASISQFINGGELWLPTFNRLAAIMGFELRQSPDKAPVKQTVA